MGVHCFKPRLQTGVESSGTVCAGFEPPLKLKLTIVQVAATHVHWLRAFDLKPTRPTVVRCAFGCMPWLPPSAGSVNH